MTYQNDMARGEVAWLEISSKKPILANRVEPAIEQAVVKMAIECPAYGQLSVSNELKNKAYGSLLEE